MTSPTCVSLSGEVYWATMNSVWALLYHGAFLPTRLVLVTHGRHKQVAQRAATDLKPLFSAHGLLVEPEVLIVPESDLRDCHVKLRDLLEKAKAEGEVSLNITPARKSLAAVAMVAAWEAKVDHIHYLYLKDLRGADRPYPLIPGDLHELLDLKELRPA